MRDAARAARLILESPAEAVRGDVFNVGDIAENYRKLDIVERLKERVVTATIQSVHKDEGPRNYRVSFEKVKTSLGFEAEFRSRTFSRRHRRGVGAARQRPSRRSVRSCLQTLTD